MRFVALARAAKVVGALLGAGMLVSACATGNIEALAPDDAPYMQQALQNALEINPVGESANWRNPSSGNRGTVTPTRTRKSGSDNPCRDYQETATAAGITRFRYGQACRRPDGAWEVVDASAFSTRPEYVDPRYDPFCGWPHDYWRHSSMRCPYWRPYGMFPPPRLR